MSKSCKTELFEGVDELEDQMGMVDWFPTRKMFPVAAIERLPDESVRGLFLLATQTTDCREMFLNQIPTYRLLEFKGLKNPNSNFCPKEKRFSPLSMMVWFGNRMSVAPEDSMERNPKIRKKEKKSAMDEDDSQSWQPQDDVK